jgi:hypothetical protein
VGRAHSDTLDQGPFAELEGCVCLRVGMGYEGTHPL